MLPQRVGIDHMGVPHEQIAEILGHAGTRTTEDVYIHQQEVIDMNTAVFDAYGNQFGNQDTQKEGIERWIRSSLTCENWVEIVTHYSNTPELLCDLRRTVDAVTSIMVDEDEPDLSMTVPGC